MSSEIKADKWSPASGTAGTIGDSGDTFTVPSGVTLNTSSATLSIPSTVITSQTEKSSLVDADKFLVSDSAASGALKYVQKSNLPNGGMTLVAEVKEMSSATGISDVQFANKFSSTYDFYRLIGYASSYDNGVSMRLRYMNNTTAYTGSDYRHLRNDETIDSGNSIADGSSGNFGEGFCVLADNTNQDNQNSPVCMDIVFFDPAQNDSGQPMLVGNLSWRDSNGKIHASTQACLYTQAHTINGFNIYCSNNNIRYYDLKLFGVHNA